MEYPGNGNMWSTVFSTKFHIKDRHVIYGCSCNTVRARQISFQIDQFEFDLKRNSSGRTWIYEYTSPPPTYVLATALTLSYCQKMWNGWRLTISSSIFHKLSLPYVHRNVLKSWHVPYGPSYILAQYREWRVRPLNWNLGVRACRITHLMFHPMRVLNWLVGSQ